MNDTTLVRRTASNSFNISAALTVALTVVAIGTPVLADSCWMHNGSVMRLSAVGNSRQIVYEVPRFGLSQIGVTPGRILFEGQRTGQTMSCEARLFSNQCQGDETIYRVSGPISANSKRITLIGTRKSYNNCLGTHHFNHPRLLT